MLKLFTQFNHLLAILVIILILAVFIVQGFGVIELPGEVTGALIASFTLVIQYFFRKAPPTD